MTEFENVLEQCLGDLERGAANVDECLSRNPTYALQLEPILLTAEYLVHGREARPSAAFKSRVRGKVLQQIHAHPRKSMAFNFIFLRFAATLAVLALALAVAGTAYAQGALPGKAFYHWKLVSENAWRAVSPDPVGADLAIADRRVDELIAVSNNPVLRSQALSAYLKVVARLQSELGTENKARILQALDSQTEELNSSGILLPKLDQPNQDENILPQFDEPTSTPTETPAPLTEIPQVNPTSSNPTVIHPPTVIPPLPTEIPPVVPTDVPNVLPTIQVPPELIPTIQIPTVQLPTIEIPSLLP
jgi:hypothetical protein